VFNKILIANRGEIACRIIGTCRRLGISTVAIYSTADETALHVKMADEAYLVGEAAPQESYLDLERILAIAKECGADAVHPGYGFLSENPAFALRCQEQGICFIGPTPEVMEKMGDKLRARKLAKKAGLPVLPGTDDAVSDDQAEAKAWMLGFPLMVKAAEGGGGIGIHIIDSMDELVPLIQRTRQVAEHAFGSPRLFFERYLRNASHIEVQIIGDQHGNLIHLYERDCSIQRRNQKLVEETPSAKLTPKMRHKLCNLALKLGNRIGYTNAGTVEFLVSQDQQVYFLEMNTRLQVEHGVTEMITGVDLVELQIRSALGERLSINQDDVAAKGHAIEARIYPEDPETFIPQVGTITDLHLPSGEFLRIDSALCRGYEVTLHYEPLLAKVMAWGADREQALKGILRALLEFRLEGVATNIPLLREILLQKEFACGTYHTGSLPRWLQGHSKQSNNHGANNNGGKVKMSDKEHDNGDREKAAALGVAIALALAANGTPDSPAGAPAPSPWRAAGRRDQFNSRSPAKAGWR
jgi:acetyl-CoA carboxylase biotin carboxylase subunit